MNRRWIHMVAEFITKLMYFRLFQIGQLEVVAILRIFTSCLRYVSYTGKNKINIFFVSCSILGALSIIGSALYRKTFCNPKVYITLHPVSKKKSVLLFPYIGPSIVCAIYCRLDAEHTMDMWLCHLVERRVSEGQLASSLF